MDSGGESGNGNYPGRRNRNLIFFTKTATGGGKQWCATDASVFRLFAGLRHHRRKTVYRKGCAPPGAVPRLPKTAHQDGARQTLKTFPPSTARYREWPLNARRPLRPSIYAILFLPNCRPALLLPMCVKIPLCCGKVPPVAIFLALCVVAPQVQIERLKRQPALQWHPPLFCDNC